MDTTKLYFRLVSAYEDKSLGLSENGLTFKFIANATRTVSEGQASEVRDAVMSLETHDSLSALIDTLAAR